MSIGVSEDERNQYLVSQISPMFVEGACVLFERKQPPNDR